MNYKKNLFRQAIYSYFSRIPVAGKIITGIACGDRKIKSSYFYTMGLIGNIIWLIFGGFFAAIGYLVGGLVLCITVVGIPWGVQCFKLAELVLWPFGKKVVNGASATGCFSPLFNLIWIIFGGWYTALVHLVMGILLSITIIGLPWARQHFKLLEISLMPFGKRVVNA